MSDLTWQAAPETAVLEHNEVHLWRVWLTQAAAADRLWPLLAADEAARARAFVFARHRQAFVTARGMLRLILSRYVGEPAAELRFDYGARGKPRLHEDQGVQFNLSHSGEMALVAVTRLGAVGVDVEQVRPLDDMMGIAGQFFAPGERARLAEMPSPHRQRAFFDCWTRKEAYIKGIGLGLSRPLDQFEVAFAPGEPARLLSVAPDPDDVARWSLYGFNPASGYAAALAVQGHGWRLLTYESRLSL